MRFVNNSKARAASEIFRFSFRGSSLHWLHPMKNLRPLFFALLCSLPLAAAEKAPANPPAPSAPAATRSGTHEAVELVVLKVFAAHDGDAIFRAYVVKWKEQEVIVSDTLAKSNYREGDTIRVLVMKNPFPQGQEPYDLLHFTIVPPPPHR
jgi:hypothetical protein